MMDFIKTVISEMEKANFSFFILIASIIQIIVMLHKGHDNRR